MIRLFTFLILLAFAVFAGLNLNTDAGYILIHWQGWTLEMTVWVAIAAWLLSILLLYLIASILRLPFLVSKKWQTWSRRKYQHRRDLKTEKGLVALAEGKWAQAERLLKQGASRKSRFGVLNYLAAARAAQRQEKLSERDNYLKRAYALAPQAAFSIGLTQAQLQLESRQYESALATLKHLRESEPNHPYVLHLLYRVYRELNEWDALFDLLPQLKPVRHRHSEPMAELSAIYARYLLDPAIENVSQLDMRWKQIPKTFQTVENITLTYIKRLMQFDAHEAAYQHILKQLDRAWSDELISYFGLCQTDKPSKQLAVVERWLKRKPNHAILLHAAARIALRIKLWGKADAFFAAAINIAPTPTRYQEWATLMEQLGDKKRADDYYKKGCLMIEP